MEVARIENEQNSSYTINDAMNILFFKLDEAVEDLENGRILTEEELWAEIDAI